MENDPAAKKKILTTKEAEALVEVDLKFILDHAVGVLAKDPIQTAKPQVASLHKPYSFPNYDQVKQQIVHRLDEIQSTLPPPKNELPTEKYKERVHACLIPKNQGLHSYAIITHFLSQHLPMLQVVKYKMLVRWSECCSNSALVERIGPRFSQAINRVDNATIIAKARWNHLVHHFFNCRKSWHGGLGGPDTGGSGLGGTQAMPLGWHSWFGKDGQIIPKSRFVPDFDEVPAPQTAVDAPEDTGAAVTAPSKAPENEMYHPKVFVDPLDVERVTHHDVMLYMDWVIPIHEGLKKMSRFLIKLKWLVEGDMHFQIADKLGMSPFHAIIAQKNGTCAQLSGFPLLKLTLEEVANQIRTVGKLFTTNQLETSPLVTCSILSSPSFSLATVIEEFDERFEDQNALLLLTDFDTMVEKLKKLKKQQAQSEKTTPSDERNGVQGEASSGKEIGEPDDLISTGTLRRASMSSVASSDAQSVILAAPSSHKKNGDKPKPNGRNQRRSKNKVAVVDTSPAEEKEDAEDEGDEQDDLCDSDNSDGWEEYQAEISSLIGGFPTEFAFSKEKEFEVEMPEVQKKHIQKQKQRAVTYVKKADWLDKMRIKGRLTPDGVAQKLKLQSAKVDAEISQICELLAITDVKKLHAELGEISTEHNSLYCANLQGGGKKDRSPEKSRTEEMPPKSASMHKQIQQRDSATAVFSQYATDPETGMLIIRDSAPSSLSLSMVQPEHAFKVMYLMQTLRMRDRQNRLLSYFNYFRSLQKRIVREDNLFFRTFETLENVLEIPTTAYSASYDRYHRKSDGSIVVQDCASNSPILYDAARTDLNDLMEEVSKVVSVYIEQTETRAVKRLRAAKAASAKRKASQTSVAAENNRTAKVEGQVDRWAIFHDILEKEEEFQYTKLEVIECFLEAYQHTTEPTKQRKFAQRMLDLMSARPRLDLPDSIGSEQDATPVINFTLSYDDEIAYMKELSQFLRIVIVNQMSEDRNSNLSEFTSWSKFSPKTDALSAVKIALTTGTTCPVEVLDFHPNLKVLVDVVVSLENCAEKLLRFSDLPRDQMSRSQLILYDHQILQRAMKLFFEHQKEVQEFPESATHVAVDALENSHILNDPSMAAFTLSEFVEKKKKDLEKADSLDHYGESKALDVKVHQMYLNLLELCHLKRGILNALYESVVLTQIYAHQARLLRIETPATLMDACGSRFGSLLSSIPSELGHLAVTECHKIVPPADLKLAQDLITVIWSDRLSVFRNSEACQYAHNFFLGVMVHTHDALMRAERRHFAGPRKVPTGRDMLLLEDTPTGNKGKPAAITVGYLTPDRFRNVVELKRKARITVETQENDADNFVKDYTEALFDNLVKEQYTLETLHLANQFKDVLGCPCSGLPFKIDQSENSEMHDHLLLGPGGRKLNTSMNAMLFNGAIDSLFVAPQEQSMLLLFNNKEEQINWEDIKEDMMARRCLQDCALLARTLAKLSDLAGTFSAPKAVEDSAAETIKNIRERISDLPANSTFKSVVEFLEWERHTMWLHVLCVLRLQWETSVAKGDVRGLESYLYAARQLCSGHESTVDDEASSPYTFATTSLVSRMHSIVSAFMHWSIQKKASFTGIIQKESIYLKRLIQHHRFGAGADAGRKVMLDGISANKKVCSALTTGLKIANIFNETITCQNQHAELVRRHERSDQSNAPQVSQERSPELANPSIDIIVSRIQYHQAVAATEKDMVSQLNKQILDAAGTNTVATLSIKAAPPGLEREANVDGVPVDKGLALFALALGPVHQDSLLQLCVQNARYQMLSQKNYLLRRKFDEMMTERESQEKLEGRKLKVKDAIQQQAVDMQVSRLDLTNLASSSAAQRYTEFYVVSNQKLGELLNQLGRDLLAWGEPEMKLQLATVRAVHDSICDLQGQHFLEKAALKAVVSSDRSTVQERLFLLETEMQYSLILEIQKVRESCDIARRELHSLANTVRSKMAAKYDSRLYKLGMEIINVSNRLTEAKEDMKEQVALHYFEIRKATLSQMVTSGSAPYNLKRNALKEMAKDERLISQKKEKHLFNKTVLKLDTLLQLKQLMLRGSYDKDVREIVERMNRYSGVLEKVRTVESRVQSLEKEMTETKASLLLRTSTKNRLQKDLNVSIAENTKLASWKQDQKIKMARLEENAKKYDAMKGIDYNKLEMELKSKSSAVEKAKARRTDMGNRRKIKSDLHQKQLLDLERKITAEQNMIDELNFKVDMVRQGSKLDHLAESAAASPAVQQDLVDKAEAITKRYEELLAQNQQLTRQVQLRVVKHKLVEETVTTSPRSLKERPRSLASMALSLKNRSVLVKPPAKPFRPSGFTGSLKATSVYGQHTTQEEYEYAKFNGPFNDLHLAPRPPDLQLNKSSAAQSASFRRR